MDTLQLSYRGELYEEMGTKLRELKELARSNRLRERVYSQIELNGRVFAVHPKGTGLFKYVLTDPWNRISLSEGLGSAPVAYAQLMSDPLTQFGVNSVEKALRAVLGELCSVSAGPLISRIDICADFATRFDFETIHRLDWVTRARTIDAYAVNQQFTGWTIGLGGAIACRLYNKSLEIRASDKLHFEDLWLDCGWDGETPVWRLEFEVKRDALRQFGVAILDDIDLICARLWRYLTQDWLRLATPTDTDNTRSRWNTHAIWTELQAVDFGQLNIPGLQRIENAGAPSVEYQLKRAGLAIIGFMAIERIDDFDEGVREFKSQYLGLLDQTAIFSESIAEDYIETKIREFVRRHNLQMNARSPGSKDPVEAALERTFRKGKDGE